MNLVLSSRFNCLECNGRGSVIICGALIALAIITLLGVSFHRLISHFLRVQEVTLQREIYHLPQPNTQYAPFPKILHHIWNDNETIPEKWHASYQSCIDHTKGYEHKLWTKSSMRKLIQEEYPWLLKTYLGYQYDIQRVDVGKVVLLYHYGGIYVDLDIICKHDWDVVLRNLSHYGVVFAESTPVGVATDTMIVKEKHPFFKYLLDHFIEADRWRGVPYATIIFGTGPMFVSGAIVDYPNKDEVYVFPNKLYTQELVGNLHGSSWHRWDGVIIYWVFTHRMYFFLIIVLSLFLLYVVCRLCRGMLCKSNVPKTRMKNGVNYHKVGMLQP